MYMYNEYNENFELDINYHHFYNQYILVDLIEHNDYKSDTSVKYTYILSNLNVNDRNNTHQYG